MSSNVVLTTVMFIYIYMTILPFALECEGRCVHLYVHFSTGMIGIVGVSLKRRLMIKRG